MSSRSVESLGYLIKKAIEDSGLKQTIIAKKMNVSRQAINQIDRRKNFDLEFLQSLKEATGIDFTNYNFNGLKEYTPSQSLTVVNEHDFNSNQSIELSLSIKIKTDSGQLNRMSDLIRVFKSEAEKLGFSIS